MDYIIIFIYSISLLMIFIFSLGQLHLTWNYLKSKKKKDSTRSALLSDTDLPRVTVQLPVYNEKYVAARLIDSVAKLNYPSHKLEIQILDDSTDETYLIIRDKVAEYAGKGFDMVHLHRTERTGFKAGALKNGLDRVKGELVAVFDADFMPDPDFLLHTVPYFHDPETGMVQTRWGHLNNDYSLLTKLQAFGLDAHFTVEQTGRSYAGSFINFNGTAGIWRKKCIIDAGGWSADTLTEDLDLSYRAQMKGWKFKYLEDVVSPAELPVIMTAIKTQQYRWNKGAAETAVKNLGRVLRMPASKTTKIHAIFHLLNSSVFIPLLVAAVLSIPMLYIKHSHPEFKTLFNIGSVFLIGFFSVGFFYWVAAKNIRRSKYSGYFLKYFPLYLSVSMGLSLHNALAVLAGLTGSKSAFIRTPKFNVISKMDSWKKNSYIIRKLSIITVLEGILGMYFLAGIIYGVMINDFGLIFFHIFLAVGFIMVFLYSVFSLKHAQT